jgi:hypothetical protein
LLHEELRIVRCVSGKGGYCEELRDDGGGLRLQRLRDAAADAVRHSQVSQLLPEQL